MTIADIATKCGYDECTPLPQTGLSLPEIVLLGAVLIAFGLFLNWSIRGDFDE